jgi:hypothetical protein
MNSSYILIENKDCFVQVTKCHLISVFGIIAYFPNPLRAQFISKYNLGN